MALPRRRFMEGERDVEGVATGVPVSKPEVKSGEYCANASIAVVVEKEENGTMEGRAVGSRKGAAGAILLYTRRQGRRRKCRRFPRRVVPNRHEAPGVVSGAGVQGRAGVARYPIRVMAGLSSPHVARQR